MKRRSATKSYSTNHRTWSRAKLSQPLLLVLALISLCSWMLTEQFFVGYSHPHYLEMLSAARIAQDAAQVIRDEKARRGLLQPRDVDPNQTGLIGPEWSEITTTLGSLPSKRTATNPDLAAVIVREIVGLPVQPGDVAVLVVSGSFVGGNIAALAAVKALGLRPVIVSSLGASMWGATDPQFSWLEMEAALNGQQVLQAKSILSVFGGNGGVGSNMSDAGKVALRTSAERSEVSIYDPMQGFDDLVSALLDRILESAGGVERVGVFINVGGATISLGSCYESHLLPTELILEPQTCTDGIPGLIARMAELRVPVLHILNLRSLAVDYGLPFDPIPLPQAGNNARVYGGPSR